MNVVVVCSVLPPSRIPNGIGEYSLQLSCALARAGEAVTLVCSDSDIGRKLTQNDFPKVPGLSISFFRSILNVGLGIPSRFRVIPKQALEASDIVLINSMLQGASVLAVIACWLARKPYILVPHGALLPVALKKSAWKKNLYFSVIGKRIFRSAAAVVAMTEAECDAFQHFSPGVRIATISCGAVMPPAQSKVENKNLELALAQWKDRKIVSCLSRVSPEKGLDLLLSAWPAVISVHPEAVLLLAVAGDALDLRNQIEILDIQSSVKVVENVSGPCKWALFRGSELVVLPSRSESFGMVVAEALASGKPVVATQGAPWSNLEANRCGRWVKVDSQSIADAVIQILNLSKDERHQMGQKGLELIKQSYSWDKVALQMIDLFRKSTNHER